MRKACIKSVAKHLPEGVVTNREIVSRISFNWDTIQNVSLERLLGVNSRRFAGPNIQVSDLACQAARKIICENQDCSIDLLIFAAASSDLIEPATANIVQTKLGLNCPVMDVKNACNSFVSAMQVSAAFIASGMYENILIVNGEKLSEVINYNPKDEDHLARCLAAYSLGDAGAAVLLSPEDGGEIIYQKFCTWGEYWKLCTVEGGGSLAFRDTEKYYFESNARELRSVFISRIPEFVSTCLLEAGWKIDDIDCLITHQVSGCTTTQIAESLGISIEKCVNTFSRYGNIAAATIPIALHDALEDGKLKKGNKLMILGLAAGISLSVQFIQW